MVDNIWKSAGYEAVEVINLRKISASILTGTQTIPDVEPAGAPLEWWNSKEVKGFRNAITARCIGMVWDDHVRICEEQSPVERETASEVATALGKQSEMTLNLLLRNLVSDNIPVVSNNTQRNQEYWTAFSTILGNAMANKCFDNKLPDVTDPRLVFWARGVRGIAIAFDLPNLVTHKAAEVGLRLRPEEHRASVVANMHGFVAHAYLPTLSVLEAFNDVGLDKKKLRFVPEAFESNVTDGKILVSPKLEIISATIESLVGEGLLGPETHCPFFSANSSETGFNLPRELEKTMLCRLDTSYYPKYAEECLN